MTRRQTKYLITLITFFGLFDSHPLCCDAFVLPSTSSSSSTVTTSSSSATATATATATCLNLVPGQGGQLVAAYNAARIKEEAKTAAAADATAIAYEETEDGIVVVPAAHRNLIRRAFSLPSSMIKRHPHPKEEGLESTTTNEDETKQQQQHHKAEDIVYYPVVGFTFCKNGDRVVALPTKSNVSCRLSSTHKEDVYGWFSPVCKLDLYSEDPCHAPHYSQEGNENVNQA